MSTQNQKNILSLILFLQLILSNMAKKPSSMGRQKIKIAKIEFKKHLQVTFSKRRSGLFKKASELCTLCGVEIAIIVFSPARKVFSFSHPNVESLIDRFLSRNNTNNNPIANNSLQLVEDHRNANVCGLNLQVTQILGEVEIEKKRGESLDQMRKTSQSQCWWEAPISQLDLQEIEQLKDSMEALKKYVTNQASTFMVNEISNSSTFFGDNGNGIFDNYDIKPPRTMPSSSDLHNHSLGFDSAALF
ncbi:agamous-like MADS-box protein AGL61 [Capsicum galapagoense]